MAVYESLDCCSLGSGHACPLRISRRHFDTTKWIWTVGVRRSSGSAVSWATPYSHSLGTYFLYLFLIAFEPSFSILFLILFFWIPICLLFPGFQNQHTLPAFRRHPASIPISHHHFSVRKTYNLSLSCGITHTILPSSRLGLALDRLQVVHWITIAKIATNFFEWLCCMCWRICIWSYLFLILVNITYLLVFVLDWICIQCLT